MKTIWNIVDRLNMGSRMKSTIYIALMFLAGMITGGAVWGIFGRLICPGIAWLICFAGYPGVFLGILGGALYLFAHEFS